MSSTGEAFVNTLVVNACVAMSVLGVFGLVRHKFAGTYEPRRRALKDEKTGPPPVPPGLFAWAAHTWRIPESFVLDTAGVDAVMFLRFLWMGVRLFSLCSIFAIGVLLPINVTGENGVSSVESLSMSNVGQGSDRLWAHLVSAYLFSGLTYHLLYTNYKQFIQLRHQMDTKPRSHMYGIMVQNLPLTIRDDESLAQCFQHFYPDTFHSAVLMRDLKPLDKLVAQREKTLRKLERVILQLARKGERPRHRVGPLGLVGPAVDSIRCYGRELRNLNQRIEIEQERDHPGLPTGFVTFKTLAGASIAGQVLHTANPFQFRARPAPEARDIYWPNASLDINKGLLRLLVVQVALFWLVFFWTIPVTFISALSSLQQLSKRLPFLKPLANSHPIIRSFLQGFLPTLALLLFMSLLPSLLLGLSRIQGKDTASRLEWNVLHKSFIFQMINVFLIVTISGSVYDVLDELIDRPTSIVSLLGTSLPRVATFFSSYVLLQAFGQFPMELLRPSDLIIALGKKRLLKMTSRERRESEEPGPLNYGILYAQLLLIMAVCLTYSSIAPIILPFGVIFFLMGYVVYKHQILYVYEKAYESGGLLWPRVFERVIVGIFVYQLTLIGLFSLKLAIKQGPFLVPLPIITAVFATYCRKSFARPSTHLPLQTAQDFDEEHARKGKGPPDDLSGLFRQPSLSASPTEDPEGEEGNALRQGIEQEPDHYDSLLIVRSTT